MPRCSVLISSSGAPANGAFNISTRSRCGTFFLGSPPSSASIQTNVAGSVGLQLYWRGPVGTPSVGTASASGRLASLYTTRAARSQTSTSLGKERSGYR